MVRGLGETNKDSREILTENSPEYHQLFIELRCQRKHPIIASYDTTVGALAMASGILEYDHCHCELLEPEMISAEQTLEAWNKKKKHSLLQWYVRKSLDIPKGKTKLSPTAGWILWVEAKNKARVVPAGSLILFQGVKLANENAAEKEATRPKQPNVSTPIVWNVGGCGISEPSATATGFALGPSLLTLNSNPTPTAGFGFGKSPNPNPMPTPTAPAGFVFGTTLNPQPNPMAVPFGFKPAPPSPPDVKIPEEASDLTAKMASRGFVIVDVESDGQLGEIAAKAGVVWTSAFYEVVKKENVSEGKRIIAFNTLSDNVVVDEEARKMLGKGKGKITLERVPNYRIWVEVILVSQNN